MNINLIENTNYTFKEYGQICALTNIDIMRPLRDGSSIRHSYGLIFEVVPSEKGVDNEGSRGSGQAHATVISNRQQVIEKHPLVAIGDVINTPFGNFRVEFYSKTDKDNLKLIEQAQS